MPRQVNVRRQFLDKKKAIRWYEIQDLTNSSNLTHVLRVDVRRAQPFVLGSIIANTTSTFGGNIKQSHKRSVAEISVNAQAGRRDIRIPVNDAAGRAIILKPLWLTNGTFFLDDCFKGQTPVMESWLAGSIVDSTVPQSYSGAKPQFLLDPPAPLLGGPLPRKGKPPLFKNEFLNRGVFLQRLGSNGAVALDFQHAGHSAAYWASLGYYSVITGAGILIKSGIPRGTAYMAPLSMGGFGVNGGQSYCCGPIIAANTSREILYLLIDRTHIGEGRYANYGRPWGNMASYLTTSFLAEIGRSGDGSIRDALVFDGGASRGLWIRKQGTNFGLMRGFNGGEATQYGEQAYAFDMNERPIPHHICFWASP